MNYFMNLTTPVENEDLPIIPGGGSLAKSINKGNDENNILLAGKMAVDKVLKSVKNNKPYQLSKSGVSGGNDSANTCIGALCDAYKDIGINFSTMGSEKAGVRESRSGGSVVEYNPTFEKNYKKAGFERLGGKASTGEDLYNYIKEGKLQPGDIIQYYNEDGVANHSNMILDKNEDGSYNMYNGYVHSNKDKEKDRTPIYKTNIEEYEKAPDKFKNFKFSIYRLGAKESKRIVDNSNKKTVK